MSAQTSTVPPALETVRCNLCGGANHRPVYRIPDALYHLDEWFQVVECLDCGLGFVNPRPREGAMDRFYPTEFFNYFREQPSFHQRRYAREASFLDAARPAAGKPRLLDVGCANGDFPRFMRGLGWEVEGVEIAAAADRIDDFPVHRVPFPRIPVNGARFDAVTAWAVLEHVHDPMAYFRKVGEVLKPRGVFAFLVTNFASVSSRYLYREDVPRHLHFFAKGTVARYLEQAGLALERSVFDGSIYEMAPLHWLRFHLRRFAGLRPLRWEELPESRLDYCNRLALGQGMRGRFHYAATHPFTTLDRALMPAYAKGQQLAGTYGIATYVARKA